MIKKILVSQPQPTSPKSPYFTIGERYGVDFVFHPFIKVEGLTAQEFRQQRIQILDYSAIVFNSRHSIDHFFTLCKQLRVAVPEDMKYFAISESVALYIQHYVQYRKRKVFFSPTGKWPELIQVMARHKVERYLVPQSSVHTNEVRDMLEAKKLKHTECVMYRTVANELPTSLNDFDMIVLFTPAGVESLTKTYPNFKQGDLKIGCWGAATAKAIEEAGLRVDLAAPLPGIPSITGCIENYIKEENGAD